MFVRAVIKLAVLLIVSACLSGCMTAAYMTGEVRSAFDERFEQSRIIAATIVMDGVEHKLRMPAHCRSYIHPMTGTRLGQPGPRAYEYNAHNHLVLILEVPYSCGNDDAHIELRADSLIKVYKIDKTVRDSVVLTWAVPAKVSVKIQGLASILSIGLDQGDSSNVVPVDYVRDEVRRHLGGGENDSFISARLERVYIRGGHLAPPGADIVLPESRPAALSAQASTFIRRNMSDKGLLGPHSVGAISGLSSEAPLLRNALSKTLEEGPRAAGFRVYYKYNPSSCQTYNADCYLSSYNVKIGDVVAPARDSPAVYVPFENTAYVVWVDRL